MFIDLFYFFITNDMKLKKNNRYFNAIVPNKSQIVVQDDDFFHKFPRDKKKCKSNKPDRLIVHKKGDYIQDFKMSDFSFGGTVDIDLQSDKHGNVVLSLKDAMKAMKLNNPLQDPILVSKIDGRYHLKDGFHRLMEAKARKYKGKVWSIVVDDSLD